MATTYTAQTWNGQNLVGTIARLSLASARNICRQLPEYGLTGRVWCETEDYTEVFALDGSVRCGPFAETTLVCFTSKAEG